MNLKTINIDYYPNFGINKVLSGLLYCVNHTSYLPTFYSDNVLCIIDDKKKPPFIASVGEFTNYHSLDSLTITYKSRSLKTPVFGSCKVSDLVWLDLETLITAISKHFPKQVKELDNKIKSKEIKLRKDGTFNLG